MDRRERSEKKGSNSVRPRLNIRSLRRAAQITEVDIGSQGFARDSTVRLAVDVDGKRLATGFVSVSNIGQVPESRSAAPSKCVTLGRRHVLDKSLKFAHETENTPLGVMSQHHRHQTGHIFKYYRLV